MNHIYFFESSNKRDKLTILTVITSSISRAFKIAQFNFIKHSYKGKPKLAI